MAQLSFRTPVFYGLAALSSGLAFSARSTACGCLSLEGFHAVIPEDGADNVPTNVKILASTGGDNDVVLVDEQDNELPLKRETVTGPPGYCAGDAVYTPNSELLPNHTYRLVAGTPTEGASASGHPSSVTFTTGDGPVEAESATAPEVTLVAFDPVNYANTCVVYGVQICLTAEIEQLLEVHIESAGNTKRYVGYASGLKRLEFGQTDAEVCVSVHVRDLAGNLSAPARRCFDTASIPVLPLDSRDQPGIYPDCDGAAVQALRDDAGSDAGSESGCSVVASSDVGSRAWPGAWLAAGALAFARRKVKRARHV